MTENKNIQRIIIAGGGTGGHIFPAVAIANALRKIDANIELLFIGALGKMEMEKVPQAGYQIKGIDIAGFNRSSLLKNISLPYKLIKSFFQVKEIFKAFPPNAVIGVGGYSTYPVLRYAQKKGIPTFIHESNSFAGKSNILLGKNASKIFVASEGMEKFFPADKIIITGNPVRKIISESTINRIEGLRFFGLEENKKTILVTGGSLGSRTINEVIINHLTDLQALNVQLIWQTGANNSSRYILAGKSFSRNVWVEQFIQDIDKAFAAADVVVARAGAMTIAEMCVAGKPTVFVPFPYAAEDHQTANAMRLVNKNAAILIKDEDAHTKLFSAITNLLMDDEKRKSISKNISSLAVTNANERIADEILKTIAK
ncbi:undecaprenyldiphospho-muramoylpentapeptide beta-N-acetylglucosaminyltransferase [Arachidicoccus sp.]|uniref:undecaprenyldiphospho-muramoylpentapeptide beta-N-acetylglucosaminyltransferase n=1 Tax=Arachidicoccus sp. TaxID=1872624 RepID=UPI003D1EB7FE